ncbi:hypothetical protein LMG33818_001641 [Halomonadaceae bacterium LMG 33818]|uniref:DUF190 domain-containing protein n=1 Tax=Cernens ardua TaxID=3402176 RepID=UPI003EDBD139
MKGYQLTFFTHENARYHHELVSDWLLALCRKEGAVGGTIISGSLGFDKAGVFHSAGFFELSDEPVAITVSADETTAESILQLIDQEAVSLSYTRVPIEYGQVGKGE